MYIRKYINLFFLCIILFSFFAFQELKVNVVNSEKEYLEVVSFFKKKLLKHYLEEQKLPVNTKSLLEQCVLWARNNGSKQQLIIPQILLVRYFDKNRNNIEIISRSKELLKENQLFEVIECIDLLKSLQGAYNRTEQYTELFGNLATCNKPKQFVFFR